MAIYGSTWEFSHASGEITEARQLSETHISGGGSDMNGRVRAVRSSTSHFNRCRIKWENGKEGFVDLMGSFSVGDKVTLVYANGLAVAEYNRATEDTSLRQVARIDKILPKFVIPASIGGVVLIFVMGIGLLVLIGLLIYVALLMKEMKSQVLAYLEQLK